MMHIYTNSDFCVTKATLSLSFHTYVYSKFLVRIPIIQIPKSQFQIWVPSPGSVPAPSLRLEGLCTFAGRPCLPARVHEPSEGRRDGTGRWGPNSDLRIRIIGMQIQNSEYTCVWRETERVTFC